MAKSLVFLCSGGGGNLRFIDLAIRENWISRWTKVVVIADRECPALAYARNENLDHFVIDFEEKDHVSLTALAMSLEPDLIVTTVHRILKPPFVKLFKSRMLNLHYSLLPSFPGSIGSAPVQEAVAYGSSLIGATVHQVTDNVDLGRPEVQVAFPVSVADTIDKSMNLVFRAGCHALLTSLRIRQGSGLGVTTGGIIQIGDRNGLINPYIKPPEGLNQDRFWSELNLR